MKKCLICNKEKYTSYTKCKLCGMGIKGEHVVHENFVFCCMKCSRIFDTFMETVSEEEREKMRRKDVII